MVSFSNDIQSLHLLTRSAPDELILKTREITLLQRPSTKDYRSVRSWFANHAPLIHGEAQYLKRKEDIITLRPGRECAGFDGFVERMLHLLDASLRKLGCHVIRVCVNIDSSRAGLTRGRNYSSHRNCKRRPQIPGCSIMLLREWISLSVSSLQA